MMRVMLKTIKQGERFKRKPDARTEYVREHYNRADSMGPATFCCVDSEDIGRSIQLKPSTLVYVEGA